MSNNKQKREYKTLLLVLANGNPTGASALLKKYSGETAQNTQDLANKLERAYVLAPYKKDIEKEFADIHPHKNFILKYTEPKVIIKEVVTDLGKEPAIVKLPEPIQLPVAEVKSNVSGDDNCPCSKCSGSFSNASGNITEPINVGVDKTALVVTVIALFGLLAYLKTTK